MEVRDQDYRIDEAPELDASVIGEALRETNRFYGEP